MRLIIDQGNSSIKLTTFEKGVATAGAASESDDAVQFVSNFVKDCPIEATMYCSVRRAYNKPLQEWLQAHAAKVICFDEKTLLPIAIGYRTPHTLGYDRIAAAVGAQTIFPQRNILIIDAGTAITYDLLSADGIFVGGNIAPGADLRLQSLHEHTGRLPLVGTQGDTPLWGYDTETALRSGSLQGIAYEIEGYIHECSKRYDELLVFLTGGDAERLAAMTKRVIFALKNEEIPQVPASRESTEVIFLDRNLVPKGLNRILEYNVEI